MAFKSFSSPSATANQRTHAKTGGYGYANKKTKAHDEHKAQQRLQDEADYQAALIEEEAYQQAKHQEEWQRWLAYYATTVNEEYDAFMRKWAR